MPSSAASRAEKRLDEAIMANRYAIEAKQGKALRDELRRYFIGLSGRLKLPKDSGAKWRALGRVELKETSPAFGTVDQLADWGKEKARIEKIVHQAYVNVGTGVEEGINAATGLAASFSSKQEFSKAVKQQVAASVKDIDIGTRSKIAATIRSGLDAGSSPATIAKQIIGQVQGWGGGPSGKTVAHSRAMVIARTETAIAYNTAAVEGYAATGIIKQVKVLDAPDCGWTRHDDPQKAAGMIVTLDEARAHPVAHPNCVRAFSPRARTLDEFPVNNKPKPGSPTPTVTSPTAPTTNVPASTKFGKFTDADYAKPKRFNYHRYNADPAGHDWGNKHLSHTKPDPGAPGRVASLYTSEQRSNLTNYRGAAYSTINDYLRGRTPSWSDPATLKEGVDHMKAGIRAGPEIPHAVVVQRGTGWSAFDGLNLGKFDEDTAHGLVGEVIEEKSFLSTGVGFAFEKDVVIHITVPKGAKGAWMSNANLRDSHFPNSADMYENEILFAPGTKLLIEKVESIKDSYGYHKYTAIEARMIDDGDY